MDKIYEYFMTPISILGINCVDRIATYLKPMHFRKALIVSDAALVQIGLINRLLAVLDDAGIFYIIYDNVSPNPTVAQVNYGLKLFKDNGCDFVVSFGGGSPHDCGKAIALLATNGGEIAHYEGINKAQKSSAPLIAINTTAGTGSELTRFCVITDEERHVKMAINDWHITPCIAVNDAALMTAMPPGLTAATGADALTHAIEAYVSTDATPVTDCKALKAVELIMTHLASAFHDGNDLNAREGMIFAEYLAGIAFNNASLGYVHALAHQLGGFYNLPHGLCNAILLPTIMEFNIPAAPKKYAEIARAMGIDTTGLSEEAAALKAVEKVRALLTELQLNKRLHELKGFQADDIPRMSANALQDVCALTNPRTASASEIAELYRSLA